MGDFIQKHVVKEAFGYFAFRDKGFYGQVFGTENPIAQLKSFIVLIHIRAVFFSCAENKSKETPKNF